MTLAANPARGEAEFRVGEMALVVRPSFAALVTVEQEIGSLMALAERAAGGQVMLAEIEALVWHCLAGRPADLTREAVGEALLAMGLAETTPVLRVILQQIIVGGQ